MLGLMITITFKQSLINSKSIGAGRIGGTGADEPGCKFEVIVIFELVQAS